MEILCSQVCFLIIDFGLNKYSSNELKQRLKQRLKNLNQVFLKSATYEVYHWTIQLVTSE